jgi:hypothetical protein|tara:strand:+ start:184 stop:816 length:633 start_codon:yes stop_codon:yes gene_type:complete
MDNRIAQLQEGQRRLRTPSQLDNMPQSGQPMSPTAMPSQQPAMQTPPAMSPPQLDVKQDLNDMLTATMADGDSLAAKALEGLIKKSGTLVQGIVEMSQQPVMAAQGGGLMKLAAGGEFSGPVPGDGHGMEDNVMMPIKEGEEQVATLAVSPTEYVVDSYTMAALGNGNPTEGAEVMDEVVENVRQKAYGTRQQPNEISGLAALRPMIERV